MTCHECQELLALAQGEQEAPEAARDHLAACTICQQSVRDQGTLRLHLCRLAASVRAPQMLRERVEALAHPPGEIARRSINRWVGIAAAVILLVLVSYGVVRLRQHFSLTPSSLAQDFILDHQHYLPGRQEIVTNSRREVEHWFTGRVDFPVRVPQLPAAAMIEARVCTIAGRKAALVHYRLGPHDTLVSFFVAPEPKTFEQQKKPIVLTRSYEGLNSKLWCHRGLVYSLVASLDDGALQQIAKSVEQQEP